MKISSVKLISAPMEISIANWKLVFHFIKNEKMFEKQNICSKILLTNKYMFDIIKTQNKCSYRMFGIGMELTQ